MEKKKKKKMKQFIIRAAAPVTLSDIQGSDHGVSQMPDLWTPHTSIMG